MARQRWHVPARWHVPDEYAVRRTDMDGCENSALVAGTGGTSASEVARQRWHAPDDRADQRRAFEQPCKMHGGAGGRAKCTVALVAGTPCRCKMHGGAGGWHALSSASAGCPRKSAPPSCCASSHNRPGAQARSASRRPGSSSHQRRVRSVPPTPGFKQRPPCILHGCSNALL